MVVTLSLLIPTLSCFVFSVSFVGAQSIFGPNGIFQPLIKPFIKPFKPIVDSIVDVVNGVSRQSRCYGDLGCFSSGGDFHRPIPAVPNGPESMVIKFYLYTRNNTHQPTRLYLDRKSSITGSFFNPKLETKVVVHGFLDNRIIGHWMDQMKTELLLNRACNVITMDWSSGNFLPYFQVTANSRVIGATLAKMITFLGNMTGASPETFHIIGHSLGAHVAGYAGERLHRLGRITGLDPAGLYFEKMPRSVKLDATDALFVDVIHSDIDPIYQLGLGMKEPIGHMDFYPNGGRNQPGCTLEFVGSLFNRGVAESGRRVAACSHMRAYDFFSASINQKNCQFIAYTCDNYQFFKEGKCTDCGPNNENCALMGFDAHQKSKDVNKPMVLYSKTAKSSPFCAFQYVVELRLAYRKQTTDQRGTLSLRVHGSRETFAGELNVKPEKLYPGSTYTYLFTSPYDLGRIDYVTFAWRDVSHTLFNLRVNRAVIEMDHLSVTPLKLRAQTQSLESFCWRKDAVAVEANHPLDIESCCREDHAKECV